MLGLDYSSGRPRGSEVRRLGYGFVIRYCGQPGNPKNATRAEVDDMLAHGVAVALVFESTAARAGQGFAAGAADARAAVAHQAALGIPASRPIYYAVDFDADPAAVEPYFRGVNSVPGPDSAYGSFRVVQRLRADGLTVDSWQTVAWSHGQVDPGRDVFQRLGQVVIDGVQCDVNEAKTADFGQYPVEDDMNLSDRLNIVLKDGAGKEYVAATPTVEQALGAVYWQVFNDTTYGPAVAATLGELKDRGAVVLDETTAASMAEKIAAALKTDGNTGITPSDVEAALRRVLTNGVGQSL